MSSRGEKVLNLVKHKGKEKEERNNDHRKYNLQNTSCNTTLGSSSDSEKSLDIGGSSDSELSDNEIMRPVAGKSTTVLVTISPDIYEDYEDEPVTTTTLTENACMLESVTSDEKTRKRKRNPELWKKRKAAIAREQGESYISQSGKNIPAKSVNVGRLCSDSCRLKCSNKINLSDREHIMSAFYKLNVDAKNALLFKSIVKLNVQRKRTSASKHKNASYKYYVNLNCSPINVCKTAFCSIFGIGRKKVDIIKASLCKGVAAPLPDKRGKHDSRPHKIADDVKNEIIRHINTFPAESSQYSRTENHPNKRYLSPLLSLPKMYNLYIEYCKNNNLPEKFFVKQSTYHNIFVTQFNLSFTKPKSDTCSTFDTGLNNALLNDLLKYDREQAKSLDSTVLLQ